MSPGAVEKAAVAAGREGLRRMADYLAQRQSFVAETTLSGSTQLRIAERARRDGWHIELTYIYVGASEISLRRIDERVQSGGHFVPDQDVKRRYSRSLANFWRLIHVCDRWRLYDNSSRDFRRVAAADAIGLVIDDEAVFRRIEEFRENPAG